MNHNNYNYRSPILEKVKINRVKFDPTNKEHCKSLKKFMQTGKWGDARFEVEFPYLDAYITAISKFAKYHLNIK